jgi:diguanylate cyclase (GGDEF)-like protein
MIDPSLLFLINIVSQSTFTLTLGLLALSERHFRGLLWFSAACALQLFVTLSMHILKATTPWQFPPLGISGVCALVLLFFCIHRGAQSFALDEDQRPPLRVLGPGVLLASLAAVYRVHPDLSLVLARAVAFLLAGRTVHLLFSGGSGRMRSAFRCCGAVLAVSMVGVVLRISLSVGWLSLGGRVENATSMLLLVAGWLVVLSFFGIYMVAAQRRLHVETRIDVLTCLHNRRGMEELAEREVRWAQRNGWPLALLMIDADEFKKVNDTWGHATGDRALRAIGEALCHVLQDVGLVGRMGGEEFAVLLPNATAELAAAVAERLRAAVEHLSLTQAGAAISLRVSIGADMLRPGDSLWTDVLDRADRALYCAKREGGNRLAFSSEISTAEAFSPDIFRPGTAPPSPSEPSLSVACEGLP